MKIDEKNVGTQKEDEEVEAALAARRAYQRAWRLKNKKKVAAYQRKYRKKNPDKIRAINERYWLNKARRPIR